MNPIKIIPQQYFCNSIQLSLSDFDLEDPFLHRVKKLMKDPKSEFNKNKLRRFIIYTYDYAQLVLKEYSSKYSKKTYSNPTKFTILAMKIYLKLTYREICDVVDLSDSIQKYLRISQVPDHSTLQKYFKSIPTKYINDFQEFIINLFIEESKIIAFDGSGFTSDNADKYYAKIRKKERKSYTKCHISIDTKSLLILDFQAQKGPRHDTKFIKPRLKRLKRFKPHYIVADKAYDSEKVRTFINETMDAFDIIPNKWTVKTLLYSHRTSA